jgi:hypothetical protein
MKAVEPEPELATEPSGRIQNDAEGPPWRRTFTFTFTPALHLCNHFPDTFSNSSLHDVLSNLRAGFHHDPSPDP